MYRRRVFLELPRPAAAFERTSHRAASAPFVRVRRVEGPLLAIALAVLGLSGCCCFGAGGAGSVGSLLDSPPAAEARRYFAENADVLVGQLGSDAGPGGSADCLPGMGELAALAVVTVVSNGHAGSDPAAQISINPGRCFVNVVVFVVFGAGVWHAVSMRGTTLDGRTASLGTEPIYFEEVSDETDSDWGSDELF